MEIVFVLVEPAVPENIGSAARAIKTMGFSQLRLVNPANHLADQAKWLAHGSVDILESARVFTSFKDAIIDLDFVIGTTAKDRSVKAEYYTPENAIELLDQKGADIPKLGIVFGREESGLTNSELRLCDIASSIPLSNPYPSINLAQSVMIYTYEFSRYALSQPNNQKNDTPVNDRVFQELKKVAPDILAKLEINKNENLYHRMLERLASCSGEDAKLLLSFAKNIKQKFE